MKSDQLVRLLRVAAVLEGVSLLLILFVTMPLKYLADVPRPNQLVGLVHGLLFVAYLSVLVYAWASRKWPARVLVWGLAASVVPLLPFWVERAVFADLDRGAA